MKMISLFWGKVGLEKSFAELFFFFEQDELHAFTPMNTIVKYEYH